MVLKPWEDEIYRGRGSEKTRGQMILEVLKSNIWKQNRGEDNHEIGWKSVAGEVGTVES